MPGPTITFGFIIATLIASLFHLVLGGDARRFATFLLAGWVGFIIGHFTGDYLSFNVMNVGSLHLLPAIFGAIVLLIFTQAMTFER